jgi:RNA polymerase sigma-70 factor (ECF subfamily)
VFLRVFQTLHSFRDERGGFHSWLSRITRNLVIDTYRKESRRRCRAFLPGEDELVGSNVWSAVTREYDPESGLERKERRAALLGALSQLCPELKEPVLLRDVKGLTYEEIAQLQHVPIGTVKSRIKRGRMELARRVRQRMSSTPDMSCMLTRQPGIRLHRKVT